MEAVFPTNTDNDMVDDIVISLPAWLLAFTDVGRANAMQRR
jgi:hypothetical protein